MRAEDFGNDLLFFAKACLSSQLARFAPQLYADLTGQNGGGADKKKPSQIANYFTACLRDYQTKVGLRFDAIHPKTASVFSGSLATSWHG